MTDEAESAALRLLADVLGARPVPTWVRAKCPSCGRRELRRSDRLLYPCTLCTPVDGYGDYFGQLLAKEFNLTAKAYMTKLENDGPPWVNRHAWIQPRSKWWKIQRPRDEDGGGVHHAS